MTDDAALGRRLVEAVALAVHAQHLVDTDIGTNPSARRTKRPPIFDVDSEYVIQKPTQAAFERLKAAEDIFLVGIGLEDDWQPAVADWTPGRYRLRPRSLLRFPLGAPEGSEQPKWLGQKVLTLSMREDSVVAIFADPVSASRPIAALSADIKSRIGSTMTDSWYAADELAAQLGVDRLEASSDDIPISQSADYVIEAAHKGEKSNAAAFVSDQISYRFSRLLLLRRYSGAGVTVAAFPSGEQVLVTIDIDTIVNRSGVLKAQSTTPMSVVAYTPKISQIVQIYSQSNDKRYVITSDLRVLPRSDVIFEDGKSRSDREKSVWLKSDATLWSALFSSNQKKPVLVFLENGSIVTSDGYIPVGAYWTARPTIRQRLSWLCHRR